MNSLLQILQQFGTVLQQHLFPALKLEAGELNDDHQQVVRVLAWIKLDRFVPVQNGRGRRARNRGKILRAFVAKAVLGIPATRDLIGRLKGDAVLRQLCGWQHAASVPDESTFSREFAYFAHLELPQQVHQAVIEQSYENRLVGHLSRDATSIEAREKPQERQAKTAPTRASRRKGGEPKRREEMTRLEWQSLPDASLQQILADLPRHCDKGCKTNSHGSKQWWIGYKLHVDVADGQVPISCLLTSASVHDSQVAIPLARISAGRVTNLYDLMDRGYESQYIEQYSRQLGHVPIIDRQKRGTQKRELDPHQKLRFRERTSAERVYSRLKDEFGGRYVRVRGSAKVMAHLMFGVLALTVDQILRLGHVDRPINPVASMG